MSEMVSKPGLLPLAVDLDGTLHKDDVSRMLYAWLLRRAPQYALAAGAAFALRGRAAAKLVMEKAALKLGWAPVLRLDGRVMAFVAEATAQGREVSVVTGTSEELARRILAAHGLVWPVVGTTRAAVNLVAEAKANLLCQLYGERGFEYAGNSRDDVKVWERAAGAYVFNASPEVVAAARALGNVRMILLPEAE